MLVALNRRILDVSGRLSLLAPRPEVLVILKNAGVHNILKIFDSEEDLMRTSEDIILQTSSFRLADIKNLTEEKGPESEFDALRSELGSAFGSQPEAAAPPAPPKKAPPAPSKKAPPAPPVDVFVPVVEDEVAPVQDEYAQELDQEFGMAYESLQPEPMAPPPPRFVPPPPPVAKVPPQPRQFAPQPPQFTPRPQFTQRPPVAPQQPPASFEPVKPQAASKPFPSQQPPARFPSARAAPAVPPVKRPAPPAPPQFDEDEIGRFEAAVEKKVPKSVSSFDREEDLEDEALEGKKRSFVPILIVILAVASGRCRRTDRLSKVFQGTDSCDFTDGLGEIESGTAPAASCRAGTAECAIRRFFFIDRSSTATSATCARS